MKSTTDSTVSRQRHPHAFTRAGFSGRTAVWVFLPFLTFGVFVAITVATGLIRLPREPIYPGQVPREVSEAVLDARDLVIQRRYDEAEKLLWNLTRTRPDDPSGTTAIMVVLMIRMLENEEDFLHDEMRRVMEINQQALDKFKRKTPRKTWHYTLIGTSLGVEGIYHLWRDDYIPAGRRGFAAIQYMKKALKTDPLNWEARLGLGIYKYYRSAYAAKVPFLPDSVDKRQLGLSEIKLAGDKRLYLYETSRVALCRIYLDAKRYNEAMNISDGLISRYPNFMIFYLFSARAAFEAGKYAVALSYYEQAYRIDPALPFAPYRAGICNEKLKNFPEAARWYGIAAASGVGRNPDKWGAKARRRLEKLNHLLPYKK